VTRRIVTRRSSGELGIFISPPGVDAFTATNAQMTLNVSSKISQLIMLGFTSGPQTIALGLSRAPFVFVTSESTVAGVIGYNGLNGPIRPSPPGWLGGGAANPLASATINGNGSSMTIGGSGRAHYTVYNSPFS
jgi:hypothetical protein